MDMFELAGTLFGGNRERRDQGATLTATGATASADGVAGVVLDADITPAEGMGDDYDQTVLDLPTSPSVAEGDEVIMTLVGDGPLKTPIVTANPGSGDRIAADASAAREIAEATGQHFWDDDSGAHVTELTRDEWEQQQSGPNSLWNSLGMLFRDGLVNLLAILTNGLAIYDGEGNTDDNIIARFTANMIRIGKLIVGPSSYDNIASIEFFDDNSELEVRQIANVDHSTLNRGMRLSSSLTDEDEYVAVGSIAESSNIDSATGTTAGLELTATVKKDYGSNVAASILLHAGKASGTRRIELFSDWLVLDGSGAEYIRESFTMQHVIDMLTTSSTNLTRSSAVSSWSGGQVRRSGKVVTVTIVGMKLASALASNANSAQITTIPAGFIPNLIQRVPCAINGSGNFPNVWAAIGTGGGIQIHNGSPTAIPTDREISLNCTYIIN